MNRECYRLVQLSKSKFLIDNTEINSMIYKITVVTKGKLRTGSYDINMNLTVRDLRSGKYTEMGVTI